MKTHEHWCMCRHNFTQRFLYVGCWMVYCVPLHTYIVCMVCGYCIAPFPGLSHFLLFGKHLVSIRYDTQKWKNKKWGRPGNEARCCTPEWRLCLLFSAPLNIGMHLKCWTILVICKLKYSMLQKRIKWAEVYTLYRVRVSVLLSIQLM